MTSSPESFPPWSPPELGAGIEFAPVEADIALWPGVAGTQAGTAVADPTPWTPAELGFDLPGKAMSSGRDRFHSEVESAYQRGFSAGMSAGAQQAEQQLAPALAALAGVAEALSMARIELEHDHERDLTGLALAVAHKLVLREITADPALVGGLVEKALELMPDAPHDVRMSPADLMALGFGTGPNGAIQWVADASLERGSFVVESPLRIVDGRTDVALRNIYERLTDA